MQTPNAIEQLYEKFRDDPAAKQVLSWLARYQNRVTETAVDRVVQALPSVTSGTVLEIFREIDRLKIGELKLGRHGQKTRILWTEHPGNLGKKFLNLISTEFARPRPSEFTVEPEDITDMEIGSDRPVYRVRPPEQPDPTYRAEGEREIKRGLLPGGASFRLIVRGKIGVKEIEALIKQLEFDKEMLGAGDSSG